MEKKLEFACFAENQQIYLVQELIAGQTFRDELQRRRTLGEDEVVELLEDVLGVLKFIHQEGIIHRDIKPENLMRRNNDRKFVLIDFGAVKEEVAKTMETFSKSSLAEGIDAKFAADTIEMKSSPNQNNQNNQPNNQSPSEIRFKRSQS